MLARARVVRVCVEGTHTHTAQRECESERAIHIYVRNGACTHARTHAGVRACAGEIQDYAISVAASELLKPADPKALEKAPCGPQQTLADGTRLRKGLQRASVCVLLRIATQRRLGRTYWRR